MPTTPDSTAPLLRTPGITTADAAYPATLAVLFGRATGRRGPSMMVREMAARQLEERRVDWGYSKPVVALDVMWNLAFVAVSLIMLICTVDEQPNVPIRLWVCGYALQCSLHVVLVWLEYIRRTAVPPGEVASDHIDSEDDDARGGVLQITNQASSSKRFESVNTLVSFLWWIAGFYWVVSGGEILLQNAPHLYWLTVVFLAFDVFFAIFCVVLACFIGIALCCCLPCIIAILYAVSGQEGASEADLCVLPKFEFEMCNDEENPIVGGGRMVPVETTSGVLPTERTLSPEDAECCICLSSYENGTELNALPCNHHFHSTCVLKWLKLNATCPLCKYNILKGSEQV